MNFLGIIPARYGSTRLIGKPLLDINGKSMIQRVYEQARTAVDKIYVATDDLRIADVVKSFGGNVVMTSETHTTGTNRCLEALEKIDGNYDAIINIQGDEPLLVSEQVKELMSCFNDKSTQLATLVTPVLNEADLFNEGEVFVVFDKNRKALYFSRSIIPHVRGVEKTKWMEHHTFYKHVGLYAYTAKVLKEFAEMDPTSLEKTESLEQNRWLENGQSIKVAITHHDTIPVDTMADLEKVRAIIKNLEG